MNSLVRNNRKDSKNYDPFLNSFFEPFFNQSEVNTNSFFESEVPRANIIKDDTSYQIQLAIAGYKKEDIDIDLKGDALTISSDIKSEDKKKFTRKEFGVRSFKRAFSLPKNSIDKEKIDASFDSGILTITLPLLEQAQNKDRKISIS